MDFKTNLLTELLQCGYADISFLEAEMESFNVDFSEMNIENENNINELIEKVYYVALNKADIEPFDEEWLNRIEIFTNALDSHLWIDDEEINSYEDIEKKI